ncbi:unnamed protein product [Notodromas monacha]|uniref:BET1-like protein n=1 Tax=Notodromas monacha TaxID=399045 RepID=A0A7R9BCI0_9CRUS|nr:unnamed protein product [Notodromas monacha]CAG0912792.1 unnamed protein product [Notodromas monacha]
MDREASMVDRQNQQRTEWLSSKVNRLKSLALDIEDESKAQAQGLLDDVGNDMDGVRGFLDGTMNRVNYMVRNGRQNRRFTCYVVLFVLGFLFVLYLLMARAWASTA